MIFSEPVARPYSLHAFHLSDAETSHSRRGASKPPVFSISVPFISVWTSLRPCAGGITAHSAEPATYRSSAGAQWRRAADCRPPADFDRVV